MLIQGIELFKIVEATRMDAEADQTEGRGSHTFEIGRFVDPLHEQLSITDMFLNTGRKTILTEVTQNHPQLESAETTAQCIAIIHKIRHLIAMAFSIAQEFRNKAEGRFDHLRL